MSLLKAASYLMHAKNFSQVRDFLLTHSKVILQDDSGIPCRFFDKHKWDIRYCGQYVGPIERFKKYPQPDLVKRVRQQQAGAIGFQLRLSMAAKPFLAHDRDAESGRGDEGRAGPTYSGARRDDTCANAYSDTAAAAAKTPVRKPAAGTLADDDETHRRDHVKALIPEPIQATRSLGASRQRQASAPVLARPFRHEHLLEIELAPARRRAIVPPAKRESAIGADPRQHCASEPELTPAHRRPERAAQLRPLSRAQKPARGEERIARAIGEVSLEPRPERCRTRRSR